MMGFFDKKIDQRRCEEASNFHESAILIDGKFGPQQSYQTVALPLGMHHHYKNQFLWLRLDLEYQTTINEDNFKDHTFVIQKKFSEPALVLPMKERFLRPYLQQKMPAVKETATWIQQEKTLLQKIRDYYCDYTYPKIPQLDIQAALYEKGFMAPHDQAVCQKIHQSPAPHKLKLLPSLSQDYLKTLLIRLMGRHYSEMLPAETKIIFDDYMKTIRCDAENDSLDYRGEKRFTPTEAMKQVNDLHQQPLDEEQKTILEEIKTYLVKNF